MSVAAKPVVVFVLGSPGSGKGTQCEKIVSTFGFVHLSAGDLLREERKSGSDDAALIESHIKVGSIVPVEITINLIKKAMQKNGDKNRFVIDGFPRNENNYEGWEKHMNGAADLKFVLLLDCPDDVCLERALKRGQGRVDDNVDAFKKRIAVHENETKPIIEKYRRMGLLRTVSSLASPEEVFEDVKKLFVDI
ncbi:UMP-CMP kinase-like [Corticium candelabrum]|uniref:UMP-CMP kinase-like n=1 Tax=Corticium candelabrum TaxID=121492 RepID=UPI002E2701B9|nr:UMP-CMP kinase-like [Corticium candelabrum]